MTERDRVGTRSRADDMMTCVQLPLENLEYTIENYLLTHGCRLDTDTRLMLAGLRDSVGRIAVSSRRLSGDDRVRSLDPAYAGSLLPQTA